VAEEVDTSLKAPNAQACILEDSVWDFTQYLDTSGLMSRT
jgi:hypothetical protein